MEHIREHNLEKDKNARTEINQFEDFENSNVVSLFRRKNGTN